MPCSISRSRSPSTGSTLSPEEWRAITRAEAGLALVRGRWIEIDPERLTQALDHWQKRRARTRKDGMSLLEAMRLLAGTRGRAKSATTRPLLAAPRGSAFKPVSG